ncbi:MAG TPA: hypothetical protein VLG09_03860 [Candidatus Saccharimonadales bacterium]|nr:hypothetical protein [Candidatus Saccharimonadales bacterium]
MPKNDMPLPQNEAWNNPNSYYAIAIYERETRLIAVLALIVGCGALLLSIGMFYGWW